MIDVAAALLDASGRPPRQGDGDDGRALVVDGREAPRWAALLDTGAHVFGPQPWWPAYSPTVESRLLGSLAARSADSVPRPLPARPEHRPARFAEAGIVLLRTPPTEPRAELWCRGDVGPHGFLTTAAHAHADALSIEVRHGGVEILADPGTYCYHGEAAWRRYFRSTLAHNTVELAGRDQSRSGGPFMWLRHAQTQVLDVAPGADGEIDSWTARARRLRRPRPARDASPHRAPRPRRTPARDPRRDRHDRRARAAARVPSRMRGLRASRPGRRTGLRVVVGAWPTGARRRRSHSPARWSGRSCRARSIPCSAGTRRASGSRSRPPHSSAPASPTRRPAASSPSCGLTTAMHLDARRAERPRPVPCAPRRARLRARPERMTDTARLQIAPPTGSESDTDELPRTEAPGRAAGRHRDDPAARRVDRRADPCARGARIPRERRARGHDRAPALARGGTGARGVRGARAGRGRERGGGHRVVSGVALAVPAPRTEGRARTRGRRRRLRAVPARGARRARRAHRSSISAS